MTIITASFFFFTDSHHKLIRWRLVTHGAIDGYSRLILYLHCVTNDRAATVLELFTRAVTKNGLPFRVRSDQGLENVSVARYMIDKRGPERRSMIVGSSTHNQRIERLWRDMHKGAVLFYKLSWRNKVYWTLSMIVGSILCIMLLGSTKL